MPCGSVATGQQAQAQALLAELAELDSGLAQRARVIVQNELTPQGLVTTVRELLSCPERLLEMEQRARSLAMPDAAAGAQNCG